MTIPSGSDTVLELVLKGTYTGAGDVRNVFHYYVVEDAGATLQQWGAGLWQLISTNLLAVTNGIVNYEEIEVKKLGADGIATLAEPYLIPTGEGQGNASDDALPPAEAWTFRFVKSLVGGRHGYKRFSGVSEGQQLNGVATSGILGTLGNVAETLEVDLAAFTVAFSDGLPEAEISGSNAYPVILHRVYAGDFLNPVTVEQPAGVVYSHIGTQNTRKYGRGS
jgi:hypothetical protein